MQVPLTRAIAALSMVPSVQSAEPAVRPDHYWVWPQTSKQTNEKFFLNESDLVEVKHKDAMIKNYLLM